MSILKLVQSERSSVKPVNPDATFQKAWMKSSYEKVNVGPTLPVKALVHGFTVPSSLVIETAVSPKKVDAAIAAAKKPIKRRAKPPPGATIPQPATLEGVDIERLRASHESRKGAKALGYTLQELKVIAASRKLATSGSKAEVLRRILAEVGA